MVNISNLSFGYKGGFQLFKNLEFEILPGNIYGFLGKNGAGKTTFLKLISGLLYSDEGSITYNSIDVKERRPEVLSEMFIIPEEFELPEVSIPNYVDLFKGFYPNFDESVLKDVLKELEVNSQMKLNSLSYGQKKKFLIAFAIASNCPLVLMDEPTNGLDIPSKSIFRRLIATYTNESRSFIISTHQVRDLENLIDPIVIVDNGQIIFNHPVNIISEKLEFIKADKPLDESIKVFHSEPVFGGMYYVTERFSEGESQVDFELLFNAILVNKEELNNHLLTENK